MNKKLSRIMIPRCCFGAGLFLIAISVRAGLTDVTQTTPNVPGGAIEKSLEQQIGYGRGDERTPGSSIYLIARDPARAVRRGRQVFQRKHTHSQGLGPRVNPDSTGNIQENPALGAGEGDSCSSCHGRPRGAAGFGGEVATRPDSRDSPHLFGLGLVEMLADEVTSELRAIRSDAQQLANSTGSTVKRPLLSKGIQYGFIQALPDGTIDTTMVEGVDTDLRVRPFFAHGGEFSIRAFAVGAYKDEMGLESADPVLCQATDPINPIRTVSPAGMVFDPTLDRIKRPAVCSVNEDHDGDTVVNEIDPALIDYIEFYLLNYFKPGIGEPTRHAQRGLRLMEKIGCTSCHMPRLLVNTDRRIADVETRFDPEKGIFNRLYSVATLFLQTVADGDTYPKLLPTKNAFLVENIFTDLKRHDLGAAFYERQYDGSLLTHLMTRPLWGVGSTAPYGHDGRSINLKEVILRHGGEAEKSKENFAALDENKQRKIIEFLETLILFPPDDTASNLNAGFPGTENPQEPAEHGSINLGALFQITSEGKE